MSSLNENSSPSPFSQKGLVARKKRAFYVLSCLATVLFSLMVYGVYIDFIRTPVSQTVFFLTKPDSLQSNTLGSFLNPQPPSEKKEARVEGSPENQALIKKLEEEKETFEKTKEALQEIVDGKSPSDVLKKLEKEKEIQNQEKLDKIEQLHQEQQEEKAKKDKKLSPLDMALKAPLKEEKKKEEPPPQKPRPSASRRNAVLQEIPRPDLIQTSLSESIPDFSTIKKKLSENIVPLHITEPLPELLKDSRYGKLPIQTENNSPLKAYARTVETPPESPYIALLFSGLGRRENITQAAIDSLPAEASLSFSPYDEDIKKHIINARNVGHETLLGLPMQQGNFPETDPGPLGLVAGLPEQENRNRLYKTLGKELAFIGLVGTADEAFSFEAVQMKSFLEDIESRGLLYIDGHDDVDMPKYEQVIRPDIHIHKNFHRAAIRAELDKAKEIALEQGSAFVRIEALPITLVVVEEWLKTFQPTEKNPVPELSFVPLSYYVKQKKD